MTVHDYLPKFRNVNTSEELEKLFDNLNFSLKDDDNMYSAANHRRAELAADGRLLDLGQAPKLFGDIWLDDSSHSAPSLVRQIKLASGLW